MPAASASAEVLDGTGASVVPESDPLAATAGAGTIPEELLSGPDPTSDTAVLRSLARPADYTSAPEPPAPASGTAAAKPVAAKAAAPRPAAPKSAAPQPVAAKPVAPQPVAPKPVATTPVAATPVRMDRQFIAQNNIIERYLTGRLPLRGAQDFERFCRDHPELLEELHLADHLHAALRLLEAGGQAPPWEEKPQRWWEKLPLLIGVCALCALLATVSLVIGGRLSAQERKTQDLEQQVAGQPLDPVQSTRVVQLFPDRTAPSQQSLATIGGGAAELADLTIDLSWSRYKAFNVTIDRVDQGRVAVLHNLQRDSNGNVRIELNSSALGPGAYRLTIDGLIWSGAPVPQAWATITVAPRHQDP